MFTDNAGSSRFTPRLRNRAAAVGFTAALLTLNACGGTSADADSAASDVASLNEVASLDTDTADSTPADAGSTLSADEAALEFSQCLRDQGLDVPDIGVDADGNVDLRDAFESIDRTDFSESMEACSDILGDTGFGGGRAAGGGADNTVIQDAMVELTACVREAGFPEATELTLGQPGGQQGGDAPEAPAGGEPSAQRGEGRGGGPGQGDTGTRFATQMGLDAEDPDVIAAMETCTPIFEAAFTDAGVDAPGQRGG